MAHDIDQPIPDEHILSRRPWYVASLGIMLAGLVLRQPLLVVAGILIGALGAVPELWYRFCLSGVHIARTLSAVRAEIGDELILTLTIENRKVLPLLRLDVEDEVPENGLAIRGGYLTASVKPLRALLINILSPWAFQRVTRRYHVRCLARGVYSFGPIRLESGDPFGILTREQRLEVHERLLVYPLVVPIEHLGLPAHAPFGERTAPRRLLEDPLRVAGVRAYAPGDEPRRIHWKATARTGALQSKVYEPSTHHTLVLFVDMRTYDNPVLGYDPARLELAICAAASIATWAIEHGYAVGLYANSTLTDIGTYQRPHAESFSSGHQSEHQTEDGPSALARALRDTVLHAALPPSTQHDQIVRIEEALARLIAYFPEPILDVLARHERNLPYGSTVVYIGTGRALGSEGFDHLARLRSRGHAVVALLTGDDNVAESTVPILRIGDEKTWETLLTEALATRGVDIRGRPLPSMTAAGQEPPHEPHGLTLEVPL